MNKSEHKFHIPVLGVGYSVDAPAKVAKYGISSVISLGDDTLIEKIREHYLKNLNKEYVEIPAKEFDSRAKRITAYLNLLNQIVKDQFDSLKRSAFTAGSEITKYFEMLPDFSTLKIKYNEMLNSNDENFVNKIQNWLRENIAPGSIDVNIMTKLDKVNSGANGEILSGEFNDAHSALRGFAQSDLESSIIFSAGMNPKLYSYLESFNDFYPDENCNFKKKIVIKVSDFRSALIQGKFLAKKGLWVSEYRIESGLNCGGHAFATDGILLGPILEEFKNRKDELYNSVKEIFLKSLNEKKIIFDETKLKYDVTVQGGVGTSSEQEFLFRNYNVSSVGWGSPFLLVPEVMNVDEETLQRLINAKEDDYYLSNVSPLGVLFNNLRNSGKDIEKMEKVKNDKPGFACTKKFLVFNKEFTETPVCTASISFLSKKIKDLKEKYSDANDYQNEYDKAVEKLCLCEGLSASTYSVLNIETPKISKAVAICPGPNLAYFSKIASLKEMVDHIYGRINLITHPDRPNFFIKELQLYIGYFKNKVDESLRSASAQTDSFINSFSKNLLQGIEYYRNLIPNILEESDSVKEKMKVQLQEFEEAILKIAAMKV